MSAFFSKYGVYLGIALAVIAILVLTYCSGQHAGKSGEVVKQQAGEIKLQGEVGKANENAAAARVADETTFVIQKRELNDATTASNNPDRQRALRGCVILRQQGRDTSNLPACR